MPSYYMHDYMSLHAAFLHYILNYMILSNYYMSLHAAFLHYMLNYMIFRQLLHNILLAITCFRNLLHALSRDQSCCRGRRSPARDSHARAISTRAISSPFSVGFILPENNPARSDRCEVLAAYGYGGGQHEVLACPGCDCKIFKQSCQDQRLNQLDQTL